MKMDSIEQTLQEVERRLKHEQGRRMFERYQTVRLHLLGNESKQIAMFIGKAESTVIAYLRTYRKHGLVGLK